jgi:DNA methylase
MKQASLFADTVADFPLGGNQYSLVSESAIRSARSGTFADNKKLPIHRWFKYSAGFSAEWAESVIREHQGIAPVSVLDPFAGSGTTMIAAEKAGANAVGYESHPFIARVAKAKLMWHAVDPQQLRKEASGLLSRAARRNGAISLAPPPLLIKCYTDGALAQLTAIRDEFLHSPPADVATRELLWLAITAILRPCSHVGTAQWQYILPNKKKAKTLAPETALVSKISEILLDIAHAREMGYRSAATVLSQDARQESMIPCASIDLVVTSPPYPNNYDYADATRLEMTFWGEIESWGDLQGAVRRHIVRSCSQHSAAEKLQLENLLSLDEVAPIADELATACRTLETVRLTKGGKKTYHTMVAAYFADLSNVFRSLRPVCKAGARLCFVIGDSAPYGVHVPAEEWLGKLAMHAGFLSHTFEKLRDRNVKWKNRKHRVPLQEGRLWIEG